MTEDQLAKDEMLWREHEEAAQIGINDNRSTTMDKLVEAVTPTRKVATGMALGLPVGVLLVWMLHLSGVSVPSEVSAAIGSLCSVVASKYTRD